MIFLLFVLFLQRVLEGVSECQIAFRMDDIQDYFIRAAQMELIKTFLKYKIPLTIGIISNNFGKDTELVSFIRDVTANETLIEVASHGYKHEAFNTIDLDTQKQLLSISRQQIESVLPNIPPLVTFITPYDVFNGDTFIAMIATNYNTISAGIYSEPCPINGTSVYRFPRGASTATEDGRLLGLSAEITFSLVQSQLLRCSNWSVVMLHPQEFSILPEGSINTTMFEQLNILLPAVKNLNCRFRLLKHMNGNNNATVIRNTTTVINNGGNSSNNTNDDMLGLCQIAFRMDAIQDYFLRAAQMELIKTFLKYEIPLTIGIISNNFGKDMELVSFIQNVVKNESLIEVANHGYNHENFRTFDYATQSKLLRISRQQIEDALPDIPSLVTFIAPYDVFNGDTLDAMVDNRYNTISAGIYSQPCPISNAYPIYHFPRAASTSTEDGRAIGVSASTTIQQIKSQLLRCSNWSVVMLHPQEFSILPQGSINTTMFEQLNILLPAVKNLNCRFRLLKHMNGNNKYKRSTTVDDTDGSLRTVFVPHFFLLAFVIHFFHTNIQLFLLNG